MLKIASALLLSLFAVACTTGEDTSSASRAIISTPCAADADCPSGFECEIEVEHGTTTSFCQADDDSGTCPAGYELEVEHGQSFCKLHGGGGGSDDASDGGVGSGTACATDADCLVTEECEIEVEHGATTGTCQLHGV